MYRIWLILDPRRALIAMTAFLFTLAFLLHFIMLSTDKYNWIEGSGGGASVASAQHTAPLPPARS